MCEVQYDLSFELCRAWATSSSRTPRDPNWLCACYSWQMHLWKEGWSLWGQMFSFSCRPSWWLRILNLEIHVYSWRKKREIYLLEPIELNKKVTEGKIVLVLWILICIISLEVDDRCSLDIWIGEHSVDMMVEHADGEVGVVWDDGEHECELLFSECKISQTKAGDRQSLQCWPSLWKWINAWDSNLISNISEDDPLLIWRIFRESTSSFELLSVWNMMFWML